MFAHLPDGSDQDAAAEETLTFQEISPVDDIFYLIGR